MEGKNNLTNERWFTMEPMRYWAPPASMNKELRRAHLEEMASSGNYFGLKNSMGILLVL